LGNGRDVSLFCDDGKVHIFWSQLAKFANTESIFPAEAESIIVEYRAIVPRLSAAVDTLVGS
jgi:hypothetical protein